MDLQKNESEQENRAVQAGVIIVTILVISIMLISLIKGSSEPMNFVEALILLIFFHLFFGL